MQVVKSHEDKVKELKFKKAKSVMDNKERQRQKTAYDK